ncbi:MAG: glycoside hydrolase, partial [Clostridiales bacterium]|nr:glycoside hydrolase [Clostridiales bacterium]
MNPFIKRISSGIIAVAMALSVGSTIWSAESTANVLDNERLIMAAENTQPIFSDEAENCELTTGASVVNKVYNDEYPGYSGEGFVWAGNSGGFAFDVTVSEGAMYEVITRCWTYLGEIGETRMQNLAIDGKVVSSNYIPNNGDWMDYSFGFFYLEEGTHTIEVGAAGGWGFILYDTVTFDYAKMPELNIDPTPSDPNATPETKALMKYLTEMYGNKIISGQQEIYGSGNDGDYELEFEYLYDTTGKYPAVRGFDFMNYNPLYGWEDGTTGRMIQWVKQRGGIATACWHINVPQDFDSYTLGEELDWEKC